MRYRYLIFSFFFHCLLVFFLLPSEIKTNDRVEIKILTLEKDSPPKKQKSFGLFSRRHRKTNGALKNFFPRPQYQQVPPNDPQTIQKNSILNSWADDFSYSNEGLPNSDLAGFYKELHRRIDSHILFESALAEYGHFGTVYFYFAVTPGGVLVPETLRAKALDRVLKVKVARVLRMALQEELPAHLQATHNIWLATRFSFKSRSCFEQARPNSARLTFCRSTSERPVAKSFIGEVVQSIDTDNMYDAEKNQIKLGIPYDPLLDFKRKTRRKETGFDPFEKESRDPDWDL